MGRPGRFLPLTGVALVVLFAPPVQATDNISSTERKIDTLPSAFPMRLSLPSLYDGDPPKIDIMRTLTLSDTRRGPVKYEFRGPFGPIVKYAQRRFRTLWNDYLTEQTSYLPEHESRKMWRDQNDAWNDMDAGGRWWEHRTWIDYLPPEKGGAPREPRVEVYGSDITWRLGPFSVSNSFRVNIENFGFLKINADPDMRPDPHQQPVVKANHPFAVDVHSHRDASIDSIISFQVKPHVRVGIPENGDWAQAIKNVSIRAEVGFKVKNVEVARLECAVGFKPDEGIVATFAFALLTW